MDPNEMLQALTGELAERLTVPVRTSGTTDERPVPSVIVDNYSIKNLNHHNDHYLDSEYDGKTETDRWFRFHYDARIELVVRHDDDVQAHALLSALQQELGFIVVDPQTHLHADVDHFKMGSSGEISYQFREPQETELNQTVTARSFHDVRKGDFDTIAEVQQSLTVD